MVTTPKKAIHSDAELTDKEELFALIEANAFGQPISGRIHCLDRGHQRTPVLLSRGCVESLMLQKYHSRSKCYCKVYCTKQFD